MVAPNANGLIAGAKQNYNLYGNIPQRTFGQGGQPARRIELAVRLTTFAFL